MKQTQMHAHLHVLVDRAGPSDTTQHTPSAHTLSTHTQHTR
jgi:hypothetical protein